MIKVMFIIGTRPEAIKMAPIIKKCKEYKNIISPIIVATSQHDELLKQAMKIFDIVPHYNFNIMREKQTLFDITVKVLTKMEKLIEKVNPQIILVQGDTTTVLACSLAGYYKKVDVGHVEAGLRSFDKYNPFPEELNRKLTDVISDIYFAPTETAKENLLREGINSKNVYVTGNSIIDALSLVLRKKWANNLEIDWSKKIILVTAHRRENFGKGLLQIVKALYFIANKNENIEIIFPVHPNPNVRKIVNENLKGIKNIKLFEPFDYLTFLNIMKRSILILTDSGGVQEEAPSFGIPVLVMRKITERPEALQAGTMKVIGTKTERIVKEVELLLNNKEAYRVMNCTKNPYGDGKTANRIIKIIIKKYYHNYLFKSL